MTGSAPSPALEDVERNPSGLGGAVSTEAATNAFGRFRFRDDQLAIEITSNGGVGLSLRETLSANNHCSSFEDDALVGRCILKVSRASAQKWRFA